MPLKWKEVCKFIFRDVWANDNEIIAFETIFIARRMTIQCLSRRIDNAETLAVQISAWNTDRDNAGTAVKWQFVTADARIKLNHLYPVF